METSILNFNKDKCAFLVHTTNTKTKKPVTTFVSQAKSRSDGIFPRTKKQSTGLFFVRCGAPSCSNPRHSNDKKDL